MFFRQEKPTTVSIVGCSVIVVALFLIYEERAGIDQIVTMILLGLGLVGYSISYELKGDLDHKKHFKFLGLTIFRNKLRCIAPEYITVFSAVFKKRFDWGPVSAMGKQMNEGNYVVRFFKGKQYFTVWKSKSLSLSTTKAAELGELLGVRVILKKS